MTGFTPFPPDRATAYRDAGYWAGRPLDEILRSAAARWPDHPAVIDDRTTLTYAELDRRADSAAAGLVGLGIGTGDAVLVQLPNSCQFAVALFGLLRAGALPVMCLPGHRDAELAHFLDVSEAVGVIVGTDAGFDFRAMAERLLERDNKLRHIIVDGDAGPHISWPQLCAGDGRPPQLCPDTCGPAVLLVSGGTTGAPKLIPRTHDDYVYNATASAQLCELTDADVYLVSLPAGHNFPLACPGLLGAMTVGATVVFGRDPSPEAAFATIARHGVTATALVPALARLWAQACEWEEQLPTTLRLLQVGGAKLAADDARQIRSVLTPGLQQVFGMAEGLLCYTRIGDPAEIVDQTQGRPLAEHDELRIVDDAGVAVPDGEPGELLVRGPYTINGYFRAEAENQRSFTPDGFYRSGDKVRRFANGYVEVTGRVKDVILRAGETISALDLESHLLTHPAVSTAAAVGLPDPYLGEKICAAIVFRGRPVSLSELNDHLDARGVAVHSRPDMIAPMPALPTTAVGKVDKRAIVAQLCP
ncbi:mycobactin salicyl-AMP ligase [Mycolicibacterium sp. BK556]|uniref:(2,3-dihydroxybenzoyl)adenylate synthase n=1 Tax=Mycobacteriaceae TaxID=1762 RepID=UPI00105F5F53|nr:MULTISPECIES: AMP-binding protein [Mycobacteriaceae]MBB3600505.1 mycobactin salicyl-AMP ligase [Mycolicibacterium sp. BK556]MBB3630258.1 mycobactin salicyl-AMP ligase [Mycolicibacterium sp. BK607]MBB3748258.1 mycobactin salicyl-AMP ligase [Mycolicibacterium sp. BK634]